MHPWVALELDSGQQFRFQGHHPSTVTAAPPERTEGTAVGGFSTGVPLYKGKGPREQGIEGGNLPVSMKTANASYYYTSVTDEEVEWPDHYTGTEILPDVEAMNASQQVGR